MSLQRRPKQSPVRRAFPLQQIKMLDDGAGTFSGYLAVFNNEDLGGDKIAPGAFTKTLSELRAKQEMPDGARYCISHAPTYAHPIRQDPFLRAGVTFTNEQKERIARLVKERLESGDLTPIVQIPSAEDLEQ
jgi:phage head maturation protease